MWMMGAFGIEKPQKSLQEGTWQRCVNTEGVPHQGTQQSLDISSAASWGQEAQWTLFCLIKIKLILQLGDIEKSFSLLCYLFSFNLQKITESLLSPL